MAEAMTVELIINAYWGMKGFWTRPRVSFQTEKSGWSDFDVVAHHPNKRILVVSESKARGRATDIFTFTSYTMKKYHCSSFAEWEAGSKNYLNFISNVSHIWEDNLLFESQKEFKRSVSELVLQLVSNYMIPPDALSKAEASVRNLFFSLASSCPLNKNAVQVNLTTPFDLFCEIQSMIINQPQGRRYGNPILDLARELNRFLYPKVHYGGRGASESAKKENHDRLLRAFGLT
jgi:hypothetical protein